MAGNCTPAVAPHRSGTIVIASDTEWHPLGGAAGEFWMQEGVELIAVAGGERSIEGTGDFLTTAAFHPSGPFLKPSSGAISPTGLAAK